MNPIEEYFLASHSKICGSTAVFVSSPAGLRCIATVGELRSASLSPIWRNNEILGYIQGKECVALDELANRIAVLLPPKGEKNWEKKFALNMRVLRWVAGAKALAPELTNWVGIYWKESVILKKKGSSELLLGAYLGARSDLTRSELVVPLKNKKGKFVAELGIDSNQLAAFSPHWQKKFEAYAETFAVIL